MGPQPTSSHVPTEDGGYQLYRAAGKLKDKKALITGGDSGIGSAVAILFAMEGCDSLIVYRPEEEKDAQETKRRVEEYHGKCILFATDLRNKENCRTVVEAAIQRLGGVNILVNNAGTQTMVGEIKDLSENQVKQSLVHFRENLLTTIAVGGHIQYKYPLNVLPLQICLGPYEKRRYHHQLLVHQSIYRTA